MALYVAKFANMHPVSNSQETTRHPQDPTLCLGLNGNISSQQQTLTDFQEYSILFVLITVGFSFTVHGPMAAIGQRAWAAVWTIPPELPWNTIAHATTAS